MTQQMRTFDSRPATRERVPLLVGLMGPSGGGKTFSALRLATGIQRVSGGKIFVIDTEARRALHYADRFSFEHVPFVPPFGPLDYLAAIDHCVQRGAGVVIVDSMSHEHEGPGGVLEQHEAEIERLLKAWKNASRDTVQMSAWAGPKAARRRMINSILQYPVNFIFCFRAKNKVKVATKQQRKDGEDAVASIGFMPIAGEEFVFEMTVNCLLLPGAGGVPTWSPEERGEKMMIKLPEQFRPMLLGQTAPLDEVMGESMAKWAAGDDPGGKVLRAINEARTIAELKAAKPELDRLKAEKLVPATQYNALFKAYKDRGLKLTETPAPAEEYADESDGEPAQPERQPGQEG